MSLRCGIVGLPNVGKSTLFNALLGQNQARTGNYAFCTVDPNVGIAEVPDLRLTVIANQVGSRNLVQATLEFTDIAGLVKGASHGEGLGNQFLNHIREVEAVAHVLRCFENKEIQHVSATIDPVADLEIVNLELTLADLAVVEKRINLLKKSKNVAAGYLELLHKISDSLLAGNPPLLSKEEQLEVRDLRLLTTKPTIYLCNTDETSAGTGNRYTAALANHLGKDAEKIVIISSKIEGEIAQISNPEERKLFLEDLGLQESGLDKVARKTRDILQLLTFFTAGPKEARAWQIRRGSTAQIAAGKVHTDFAEKFIRAEVISYQDYLDLGPELAKEKGKVRFEGRDYLVQEGDVIIFHHS